MTDETVTIVFFITDMERFRESYKQALQTSGYSENERCEKLASMDNTTALAEIMADGGFNWENFGLGF